MFASREKTKHLNTDHGAAKAAQELRTSAWLANCGSFQIPPIWPKRAPWADSMSPPQAERLIKAWTEENLSEPQAVRTCIKEHIDPFVRCTVGAVYMVPLCCRNNYVGQTKHCINDRLNEHKNAVNRNKAGKIDRRNTHKNAVRRSRAGNLATHCNRLCKPNFQQCIIIAISEDERKRKIIESWVIANLGKACLSAPSLKLSDDDMQFLNEAWKKYAWFFRSFKYDIY